MSNNGSGSNNNDWQDAETGWYQGANSAPRRFDPMTGKPLHQHESQSQPSPPQASQRHKQRGPGIGAIAGITVVVLAAVVGFGIVWFFNGSKDNAPAASQQSVNRAPTQPAESDSSSNGSSSSSPTSTADFPASARATCKDSGSGELQSISDDNVRADSELSCGFIDNIAHDARQHLQDDPSTKTFNMSVWSESTKDSYDVSCHNDAGLTSCYTTSRASNSYGDRKGVFIRD